MYCDSARWMKSSVGDGGGAPVSDLVSPFWPKIDIWRSVGGESRWVGGRSRVGVEKSRFSLVGLPKNPPKLGNVVQPGAPTYCTYIPV